MRITAYLEELCRNSAHVDDVLSDIRCCGIGFPLH